MVTYNTLCDNSTIFKIISWELNVFIIIQIRNILVAAFGWSLFKKLSKKTLGYSAGKELISYTQVNVNTPQRPDYKCVCGLN